MRDGGAMLLTSAALLSTAAAVSGTSTVRRDHLEKTKRLYLRECTENCFQMCTFYLVKTKG